MPESLLNTPKVATDPLGAIALAVPGITLTDALAIEGVIRDLPPSRVRLIRDLTRLTGCTVTAARDAIAAL